jgi:DNA-binding response OmpR family regulator
MNIDPPGTDDDSIDVFVLCGNSSDATLLGQKLLPHGYRLTFFDDSTQLADTIRTGKPNLLICDATSSEPDGYLFCRELKADDNLWQIPVLLITGVSSLADLLKVLDSNADNFITQPFDISNFLALIEGMIAERVERPDPDKLKTKFKILHDDHEYVIMADRRKLLEFLLSSYELAVNRAETLLRIEGDLEDLKEDLKSQVKTRTQALSDDVERLEGMVKDQTRALAQNAKEIHDQRAAEKELRSHVQDNEAAISRSAASLTKVTNELDRINVQHAEAEEKIRTLIKDKEQVELTLHGEIDALRAERDGISTEHESAKRELSEAYSQISSHEDRHADLTQEKEQTETTLRSYSVEMEELKRARDAQQERATAAEQKVQQVTAAKAESEDKFQKKVSALAGEVQQLAGELAAQKKVLDTETKQQSAYKEQVRALSQEKEKREATLTAERESLREQRDSLLEKVDATTASLGAEREKNAALAKEHGNISSANEMLGEKLHTITRRLEIAETALEEEKQLRFVSEKNAKEASCAKDEAIQSHQRLLANLNEDVKSSTEKLAFAYRERDTLTSTNKTLKEELAAAVLGRTEQEKLAQTLTSKVEEQRALLETERRERRSVEERLDREKQLRLVSEKNAKDAWCAKDDTVQSHQRLLESLNENGKTHNEKLTLAYRERDAIASTNKTLEAKLAAAVLGRTEQEKLAQSFPSKMEKLQALLETEQYERRRLGENLEAERQSKVQIEQRLRTVTEEKAHEHDSLVTKLQTLTTALEEAVALQKSREQQLKKAEQHEKEKEDALVTLRREFEQLHAVCDAKKEELQDTNRHLADAHDALSRLKQPVISAVTKEAEADHNHALTLKKQALPRIVETGGRSLSIIDSVPAPHHLVIVPEKHAAPSISAHDEIPPVVVQCADDLFEDDHEMDIDELPDAIIEPALFKDTLGAGASPGYSAVGTPINPDDQTPTKDAPHEGITKKSVPGLPDTTAARTTASAILNPVPDAVVPAFDADTTEKQKDVKVTGIGTLDEYGISAAKGNMPFDRRQWFDLVKWAHSAPSLSRDDKLRIVRLGRLIQTGRRLRPKQENQVAELVSLAYSMGYKSR